MHKIINDIIGKYANIVNTIFSILNNIFFSPPLSKTTNKEIPPLFMYTPITLIYIINTIKCDFFLH